MMFKITLFITLIIIIILGYSIFKKKNFIYERLSNRNILTCITISVNYHKELDLIIPENIKFFDKWIIVTSKEDTNTISIINKYNKIYNNKITILYYDFKKHKGSTFDKGGGIKYAQEYINNLNNKCNLILLLDSDIILPNDFNKFLEEIDIDSDTLICSDQRLIYKNIDDYINKNKKNTYIADAQIKCLGYFQLYKKSNNKFYQKSINASKCDLHFGNIFKKKKMYNKSIIHLGEESVNWNGK